jgi:hypothetical protein
MSDSTEKKVTGSCVCGAVAFEIQSPFMVMQYCHCSRCRKSTGSAHAANLFVDVNRFSFVQGEDQARRWDHPEAKYWSRGFCAQCGSSIPYLTRTGKAYVIPGGNLDDDPGIAPSRNIYFASRAPWYVHASELPTHDAFPRKS